MQSTQTPHSSQCTKKVKWQAANQVGVPNLYLHKYHLYHSRCTSSIRKPLTSNRHLKDSPQGLQVKFGMEFSSLEWQGKASTANTYHAWAKMHWVIHRRTVRSGPTYSYVVRVSGLCRSILFGLTFSFGFWPTSCSLFLVDSFSFSVCKTSYAPGALVFLASGSLSRANCAASALGLFMTLFGARFVPTPALPSALGSRISPAGSAKSGLGSRISTAGSAKSGLFFFEAVEQ